MIHKSAQKILSAATLREKEKLNKYSEATKKLPTTTFIPIVLESYGGMGQLANQFLQTVTLFANENSITTFPDEFMRTLRDSLAITLQKGNVMMLRAGLALSTSNISASRIPIPSLPRTPMKNIPNRSLSQPAMMINQTRRSLTEQLQAK